tara:strand:+ start:35197 stop:35814 length:618 start_codon:yes stop_codon:yes gene_type:complete
MGDPVTTGLAVSAVQGIASYQEAKDQAEMDNAIQAINNKQVYESMLSSYKSLEIQADQVEEAFIAESIDQQKAEARARGSAEAASGASGTGGSGLEMQVQEASVEGAMNTARMKMNRDRQLASISSQGEDAVNVANQRLDRMPKKEAPSLISTALNIGMNGFRNTTALQGASNSWDSNFGGDDGSGFSVDSLVDSPVSNSGLRTA